MTYVLQYPKLITLLTRTAEELRIPPPNKCHSAILAEALVAFHMLPVDPTMSWVESILINLVVKPDVAPISIEQLIAFLRTRRIVQT